MRLIPLFNAILRSILNANGNRIINVGEPTEDNDAATKKYVREHAVEPADYPTVRQNAETGAAHAADPNPHVTVAEKQKWNAKQDALTPTQLAAVNSGSTKDKIDAIDEKLDKGDVIDPATATTTGKAADAYETGKALAGKLDKSGGEIDDIFSIQSKNRFSLFETSYTLDGVKVPAYIFVAGENENGEKTFGIGFGSDKPSDMVAPPGMSNLTIRKEFAVVDGNGEFVGTALTAVDSAIINAIADKLTDSDIDALCTACGISLAKPDGTKKTRAEKLLDLFGQSNSQLAETIRAKVLADGEGEIKAALFADKALTEKITTLAEASAKYKLVTVGADGNLTDRAINTTSASSVTVPDDYTDLLIRATVTGSLSVTVPEGVTKYGDAFPAESGEYLVTITKLATGEAFVKTLKLEVANA